MRTFKRPRSFDLYLSMFTSFGYFESKADDVSVLQNIHDSLIESGSYLVDVVGKEWLAKQFRATSSRELDDGTLMIERHEILDDWYREGIDGSSSSRAKLRSIVSSTPFTQLKTSRISFWMSGLIR